MTTRRRRAWGAVSASLALACLVLALPLASQLRAAAADSDAPFTLSVSPVEGLGDGQVVTITATEANGASLTDLRVRQCKPEGQFHTVTTPSPNPVEFASGTAFCPDKPLSSSAPDLELRGTVVKGSSTIRYRVGSGTISWQVKPFPPGVTSGPAEPGSTQDLACDDANACSLVVYARTSKGGVNTWTPVVQKITFKSTNPIEGCGGPAPGILLSGASDRMQDAWISWTLDECHQDGRTGGASNFVANGEGTSMDAFAAGRVDLAYSAAGYGDEVGLLSKKAAGAADTTPRESIAIPVALNAAVIAVAGGRFDDNHIKLPYEDLKLTVPEAAGLVSGGVTGLQPHYKELFERNPELNQVPFDIAGGFNVGAPSETTSVSWFFTNMMKQLVPNDWKVPDKSGEFGPDAGRARGATAAMATADPTFAQSLLTLTGRPPIVSAIAKLNLSSSQGGEWILTDSETATALGLPIVSLANAAGDFVPVTKATVTAGVERMKATDNGLLLPDPKATDKVDGATPLPLAFVEYAIVPAEPLVTTDCKARADSQALLQGWLTYLLGRGQEHLPAGMYPLTPDLVSKGQADLARVGKSDVTGACAGKVGAVVTTTTTAPATTTTTTAPPATTAPAAVADAPVVQSSGGSTPRRSSGGTATTSPPAALVGDSAPPTTAPDAVELASVPTYAGRRGVSPAGPVLALLVLAALSGLAALAASGRSLREVLARDGDR